MKENYAKRHRNGTAHDQHTVNQDAGPLTSPGAHSKKGDAERAIAEREKIAQAVTSLNELPAVNEKALKRAEQSIRNKTMDILATVMEKHAETNIRAAYEDYFEKLDPSDESKEAQAVRDDFRKKFITPDTLKEMEASRAKRLAEDIDFQQFRIYKRAHAFQQQMMLTKYQLNLAMAGRRSGKTEGNVLLTGYQSMIPESRVLIIALTYETAQSLYWHPVLKLLDDLSLAVAEKDSKSGTIRLANGSIIKLVGNSNQDEREKLRGGKWHLIIIDEVQSQKALPYLIHDVCEPMLLDFKGKLWLTGTGPRVRSTMWEDLWLNAKHAFRLNWNLTQNPFIPDHDKALKEILVKKGLRENDPLFLREYMGQIAYDDDALVVRFKDENFYQPDELRGWIANQPVTDIHFIGGIDYGHSDHDAFCIIAWSDSKPELYMVYQYKMNLEGIASLAAGIKAGLDYVATDPMFSIIPRDQKEDFYIFADTSDGRASSDLMMMLKVNIFPAYKHDKAAAVDFLQEDVRLGNLKIPRLDDMSPIEDEAMKTLFLRDDKDNLTREIDEDTYHADMIPATMYALRSGPWQYRS